MTLNANFAGARVLKGKLDGPERALDGLIGLIILIAELLIGFLAIATLYEYGATNFNGASEAGFGIALFGSIIVVFITTIVYLTRLARGRRSWGAPLWGIILMTVALVAGYLIMSSGA